MKGVKRATESPKNVAKKVRKTQEILPKDLGVCFL